jgi:hypothetical protein
MADDKGKVMKRGGRGPKTAEQKDEARKKSAERQEKRKVEALENFRGVFSNAVWTPIDNVQPYEKNPKQHPKEQVRQIAQSIQAFNWDQPIVVDGDGIIIKGHGRYLAARMLNMDEIPVITRTDMSENEVRASRIADNQTAESYWHIGNLLREMEALYGADQDLNLTGYTDAEIKKMYPGLLETDADFVLLSDSEGTIPSDAAFAGVDGLVGSGIPETGEGAKNLTEWVNAHDRIIVPFSGDRMGLAALCWCLSSGIPMSKTVIVDTFFGQRLWRWHDEYIHYIENALGVTVQKSEDKVERWYQEIKERGWPSKENPWCCNKLRSEGLRSLFTDSPENTVIVWGQALSPEGKPIYRQRGKMPDTGVHYAAPFCTQPDTSLTAMIESNGIKLNPLYNVTDLYLCPGCPRYERPDFVFLKEHDLDLWIRWVIYFGKSQWCREYVETEKFDEIALSFIGDGIEAREFGNYRDYAQELPECVQPDRVEIREGDDYGWDPDADAKLPPKGRLDRPRGNWWKEVGTSEAYKQMKVDVKKYHEDRGDMSLDEWLKIRIKGAKDAANAEPGGDGKDTSAQSPA